MVTRRPAVSAGTVQSTTPPPPAPPAPVPLLPAAPQRFLDARERGDQLLGLLLRDREVIFHDHPRRGRSERGGEEALEADAHPAPPRGRPGGGGAGTAT